MDERKYPSRLKESYLTPPFLGVHLEHSAAHLGQPLHFLQSPLTRWARHSDWLTA